MTKCRFICIQMNFNLTISCTTYLYATSDHNTDSKTLKKKCRTWAYYFMMQAEHNLQFLSCFILLDHRKLLDVYQYLSQVNTHQSEMTVEIPVASYF